MAKKKQGLSPTFKAGLVVIIVLGLIGGVTTLNQPWYGTPKEAAKPVAMVEETEATPEVPTEAIPAEAEPKSEATPAEAEPTPEKEPEEEPTTLPEQGQDNFDYSMDLSQFANTTIGWSFKRNAEHSPVIGYNEGIDLPFFDGFYRVSTEEKVVYLTFDEGYENGFTENILNILKDNSVHAAFFVTEAYIRSSPELAKRMKEEGHIVGNHSVTHPSMPSLSYDEQVNELKGTDQSMEAHTGYKLDMFFRPPMGEFSEQSLYITRQQGYKTIFWSMAYKDWDRENQPGKDVAYQHVIDNVHPGAIILLHAVSESNSQALDAILKELKAEGYRFGSLNEIQSNYSTQ